MEGIMDNTKFLDWYYDTREPIYGLMYNKRTISKPIEEDICFINHKELKLSEYKDSFIFIWGWPGPDYNLYKFKDYGVTWAFTKEELINYYKERE